MERKNTLKNTMDHETFFSCIHCTKMVNTIALGTSHRNHCPHCLWSKHVDLRPGDRMSFCQGQMEPVAIWVKDNGEWSLLHRCSNCGVIKPNRVAGDDDEVTLSLLATRVKAAGL